MGAAPLHELLTLLKLRVMYTNNSHEDSSINNPDGGLAINFTHGGLSIQNAHGSSTINNKTWWLSTWKLREKKAVTRRETSSLILTGLGNPRKDGRSSLDNPVLASDMFVC